MSYAALRRERAEDLEVLLMKAKRDLFRARRTDLDVEIHQVLCELLQAVTRPEGSLFLVASESWNPTLLCNSRPH